MAHLEHHRAGLETHIDQVYQRGRLALIEVALVPFDTDCNGLTRATVQMWHALAWWGSR